MRNKLFVCVALALFILKIPNGLRLKEREVWSLLVIIEDIRDALLKWRN